MGTEWRMINTLGSQLCEKQLTGSGVVLGETERKNLIKLTAFLCNFLFVQFSIDLVLLL